MHPVNDHQSAGVIIIPARVLRVEVSRRVAEQWRAFTAPVPGLREYIDALNLAMAEDFDRRALSSLTHGKRKTKIKSAASRPTDRRDRKGAAFATKRVSQRKTVPHA